MNGTSFSKRRAEAWQGVAGSSPFPFRVPHFHGKTNQKNIRTDCDAPAGRETFASIRSDAAQTVTSQADLPPACRRHAAKNCRFASCIAGRASDNVWMKFNRTYWRWFFTSFTRGR
ncbi:hypothetical protein [Lignipirellula cremea]|uniref:hypothetical protein n=1 Tax=Lignipirellula cremea TaxID=2528010 RepID=UPI0011AA9147|nr:hypothetical protein [Lignipirellula cremea]